MKRLLLDSSVIIDLLRRKDKENSLLFKLSQQGYDLAISIITYSELFGGRSVWEHKQAKEELTAILSNLSVLYLNDDIAERGGEIRATLGTNLLDALIAATTLWYDLELVTLNVKDFAKIKGVRIYGLQTV